MNPRHFLPLLCLSALLASCGATTQDLPPSSPGLLDLRDWNPFQSQPLEAYWVEEASGGSLRIPKDWGTFFPKGPEKGREYRFHLKLRHRADSPPLSLVVGTAFGSWELAADGRLLARSDQGWSRTVTLYPRASGELNLIWIYRPSGPFVIARDSWNDWTLGEAESLVRQNHLDAAFRWFQGGVMIVTGIFFLGFFILRRKEKSSLYFSTFNLFLALRVLSNQESPVPALGFLLPSAPPEALLLMNHALNMVPLLFFLAFLKSFLPESWIKGGLVAAVIGAVVVLAWEVGPFLLLAFGATGVFLAWHDAPFWSPFIQVYALSGVALGVAVLWRGVGRGIAAAKMVMLSCVPMVVLVPLINLLGTWLTTIPSSLWWGAATLFMILIQGGALVGVFVKALILVERHSENLMRLNHAYYRFVPRAFLDLLGKDDIAQIQIGDQTQREMTILFGDVRDFTSRAETLTPDQNFRFVNDLLKGIGPIIRQKGGFIDKFLGDGFMALFPDGPREGLRSALEVQSHIDGYNDENSVWPVALGMGINAGLMTLGCVGEPQRMDGTVIADSVNLAARLESLTKVFGARIIFGESVLEIVRSEGWHYRTLGRIRPKGKKNPVTIHDLFQADSPQVKEKKLETLGLFDEAMGLFQGRRWKESESIWKDILVKDPRDQAARFYLDRIQLFALQDPGPEWDGVVVFHEK